MPIALRLLKRAETLMAINSRARNVRLLPGLTAGVPECPTGVSVLKKVSCP